MDAIALGAVTAVWHRDVDEADRWFDLVGRVHDTMARQAADEGTEVGWEQFKAELARQAGGESFHADVVSGLTSYLERWSQTPLDVIAQLADPDNKAAIREAYSAAVAAYVQPDGEAYEHHGDVVAAADGSPAVHAAAPAVQVDQAALDGYLKQWSGQWDGAEQTWANFAERVVWYAPDELKAAVGEFVGQVGSGSDKAAALADKGLAVGGVPAATGDKATGEPAPSEPKVTDGSESPDAAVELSFDPDDLASELIDEAQLAEAIDAGLIRFDPIDEDELELETA